MIEDLQPLKFYHSHITLDNIYWSKGKENYQMKLYLGEPNYMTNKVRNKYELEKLQEFSLCNLSGILYL